jgi:hypothetical protein
MFLGMAMILFEVAGKLASEQRTGWGWFIIAGMILSGVALNLWTEASPPSGCPQSRKSYSRHDFD